MQEKFFYDSHIERILFGIEISHFENVWNRSQLQLDIVFGITFLFGTTQCYICLVQSHSYQQMSNRLFGYYRTLTTSPSKK